jgi:hypothetical protein
VQDVVLEVGVPRREEPDARRAQRPQRRGEGTAIGCRHVHYIGRERFQLCDTFAAEPAAHHVAVKLAVFLL